MSQILVVITNLYLSCKVDSRFMQGIPFIYLLCSWNDPWMCGKARHVVKDRVEDISHIVRMSLV